MLRTFSSATLLAATMLAAPVAAHAADAIVEPIAVAPASPWTGFYVGGSIGGTFLADESDTILFDTDLDGGFGDTIFTDGGGNAFAPGFCSGVARGNEPVDGCDDDDDSSVTASLRAGYDVQFGGLIVGVVGEVSALNLEDVTTAFSGTPAFYSIVRELDFMAAARARVGFGTDRFLGYVTGGAAFADIDYSFRTSNNPNVFTIDEDVDSIGYQIGGGVETLLSERLSVGLEYLFTSFGDDSTVRSGPGPNTPADNPFILVNANGTDFTLENDDFQTHTVSLTASFRF